CRPAEVSGLPAQPPTAPLSADSGARAPESADKGVCPWRRSRGFREHAQFSVTPGCCWLRPRRGGVEVVSPPEVRADLTVMAAVVARYGLGSNIRLGVG